MSGRTQSWEGGMKMSDLLWIIITAALCGMGYLVGWTLGFQKGFNKASGGGLDVNLDDLKSLLTSLKEAKKSLDRLNKRDEVKTNV